MFYMEDAVEGIHSPLDYLHLKILRFHMMCCCYWPNHLFGEKTWKISKYRMVYPLSLSSCIFVSMAMYLYWKTYNFLQLGHMLVTLFLTIVALSRSTTLVINSKFYDILVRFFTSYHLFHHKNKTEYAKEIHIRMHKVCHLVSMYVNISMAVAPLMFNVIPFYLNYAEGKLKYSVLENTTYRVALYLYYPTDSTTNRNSYLFVALFSWYSAYICSVMICMTDLLLFLMVFHTYGHFKILLNILHTLPTPALVIKNDNMIQNSLMFSQTELQDVFNKLRYCIDYHKYIISFTEDMSRTFGPMLFVYLGFHQTSSCLLLLECSQMSAEAVFTYVPLSLTVIMQLIQISVIFEIIGSVSERLKDAIYGTPWECMDLKNRKLILIFLMNAQTPVHVKAMGVVNVGVGTMAAILKTSISYFTFLRTVPT